MGLCCRDVPRNDAGLNRPGANNPIREDSQWASDPVEGVAEADVDGENERTMASKSRTNTKTDHSEDPRVHGVLDVRGILGGPGAIRGKATLGARREFSLVSSGRASEKP